MLLRKKDYVLFDLARCVQCGTCLAVCPREALDLTPDGDGLWIISPNKEKCDRCFKCIAACPAHHLPQQKIQYTDLNKVLHLQLAHAADQGVRAKSSSGGAARVLAHTALESGQVSTVYSVVKTSHYPWAEGSPLTHPLDISRLANSMYLPILVNKNLNKINEKGPILLIGTTCQLLAAERILKKTSQQIYKIAIFCKQQKNLRSTCFMAKRLRVDPIDEDNTDIEYRSGPWPGYVQIDGKQMKWEVAAALPYGKRLWRIPGCRFCPNPFGVDVDLTLADPWGIDRPGEPGNTLIAVWTQKGKDLLNSSQEHLVLKDIDKNLLAHSVSWKDIQRKNLLVDYYLGQKVSWNINIAGLAERMQTFFFQKLLERTVLPEFAYKILAHLPDATNIFIKNRLNN